MVTFIETRLFSRIVHDYLEDASYARLQQQLSENPEAGVIVRGSGGVRKLRWPGAGRGKSGGVRLIYYARTKQGQIWMLTIYAKNEESAIPAHILRQIREEIDG
jgi:mRNA-degrading endonuclease RelE of RelBE toxin-antitoxin system